MTRRDILECVHEPFGDAFYYGPERLSDRFEKDEATRVKSGFANTTYKDVMDQLGEKAAKVRKLPWYLPAISSGHPLPLQTTTP
jgi:hypothetical protein